MLLHVNIAITMIQILLLHNICSWCRSKRFLILQQKNAHHHHNKKSQMLY